MAQGIVRSGDLPGGGHEPAVGSPKPALPEDAFAVAAKLIGQELSDFKTVWATAPDVTTDEKPGAKALAELLLGYYPRQTLETAGLKPYSFRVEGEEVTAAAAIRNEWVGKAIQLDCGNECYKLVPPPSDARPCGVPADHLAQLLTRVKPPEKGWWTSTVSRLTEIDLDGQQLSASFSPEDFYSYRFSTGLLYEETAAALAAAGGHVRNVLVDKRKYLPLREHLLRDGRSLFDLVHRQCIGGVVVMFAIATPNGEFRIPIQKRSTSVADGQGLVSLVPQGFHQPIKGRVFTSPNLQLSSTVYREVFEELFGGSEAERPVGRLDDEWFFKESAPMRWIREHPEACTLHLVSFALGLMLGDYNFGVLLTVSDSSFWESYHSRVRWNWEIDTMDPLSSRDREAIAALIQKYQWTAEGLITFVEALKQLAALFPGKVCLPEISPPLP